MRPVLCDYQPVEQTYNSHGTGSSHARRRGQGIGRIPKIFIQDKLRNGELVEILNDYKLAPFCASILYPDQKRLNKRTRLFIEMLVAEVSKIY